VRPPPDPLVAISGMLGDASLWNGVIRELGDDVTTCPTGIDEDDSVPAMAATVLSAAPQRFALVGHSLGAVVAMEVMRQAPERVSRLALANASGRAPSPAQQATWSGWRQRTLDGEFADIASELAAATLARSRRDSADLLAANLAMARGVGPAGFLRQLAAQSTRPDSRSRLRAIEVPVVVLSGSEDEICPPALQQELVEHCRQAELATIAGGGHMLPLECPDAVADHLRRWLS
jgi:pimeloyl-ACP methyl ester carboxylesterase